MSAGTIDVRARVTVDGTTVVDRSFTIDPADTAAPWFDVMAGLVDVGRTARDAAQAELAMAVDQ